MAADNQRLPAGEWSKFARINSESRRSENLSSPRKSSKLISLGSCQERAVGTRRQMGKLLLRPSYTGLTGRNLNHDSLYRAARND